MNSTKVRFVTAAIVAALVYSLYAWLDKEGLAIVTLIATLGANYEFIKLCFKKRHPFLSFLFFVFSLAIYLSYSLDYKSTALNLLGLGLIAMAAAVMLKERNVENNEAKQSLIATSTLGFIYLGILPGITTHLILSHTYGIKIFFICIVTVVTTDVMAYFCGRKFGTSKLLPSISPNKTKAGAYAGTVFATLAALLTSWLLGLQEHLVGLTLAGSLASVFAQFGDLFESILKRNAGAKDSGRIMPGHGGYLDRLDSILFSFPLFYCYVNWFM